MSITRRIGMDLVSVGGVRASLEARGDRYLHRVYTETEIRECTTPSGVDPRLLAARFAAKEAVVKALRVPGDEPVAWRSIEVREAARDVLAVRLDGEVEAIAARAGLGGFAVSVSAHGEMASAIVTCEAST